MIWFRSAVGFAGDLIRAALAPLVNRVGRALDEAAEDMWTCDDCCDTDPDNDAPIYDALTSERFRAELTDDRLRRFIEGTDA